MSVKKDYGIWTETDLKQKHIKVAYAFIIAVLLAVSAVCLFPVIWIFLSCFKDIKEFMSVPPTIIPKSFHPEKIVEVWNKVNFGRYYLNTLITASGSLVFSIMSNGLAGYVISRLKPAGAKYIFVLITWTMLMPSSVSTVPLFMYFVDVPIIHVNLSNTYLPLWIMAGANAFYILMFKNFFDAIPVSYVEAAKIDGCKNLSIFFKIILPLSKSIIMVVAIFTVNGAWGDFFWPYLLLKDEQLLTVAVKIFNMKNGAMAMDTYVISLFFAIMPPIILFLIFQKQILGGFQNAGVKG